MNSFNNISQGIGEKLLRVNDNYEDNHNSTQNNNNISNMATLYSQLQYPSNKGYAHRHSNSISCKIEPKNSKQPRNFVQNRSMLNQRSHSKNSNEEILNNRKPTFTSH